MQSHLGGAQTQPQTRGSPLAELFLWSAWLDKVWQALTEDNTAKDDGSKCGKRSVFLTADRRGGPNIRVHAAVWCNVIRNVKPENPDDAEFVNRIMTRIRSLHPS